MKTILTLLLLASMALALTPNLSVCQVTDFGTPVKAAGFGFAPGLFDTPGQKMAAIGAGLTWTGTIAALTSVIAHPKGMTWVHKTAMGLAVAGWLVYFASHAVR